MNPASRVTVLDGTPACGSPLNLYMKFKMLDDLESGRKVWPQFKAYFHFKRHVTVAGGFKGKAVVGFREDRLAKLTEQASPYCSRVEARDVLAAAFSQNFLRLRRG